MSLKGKNEKRKHHISILPFCLAHLFFPLPWICHPSQGRRGTATNEMEATLNEKFLWYLVFLNIRDVGASIAGCTVPSSMVAVSQSLHKCAVSVIAHEASCMYVCVWAIHLILDIWYCMCYDSWSDHPAPPTLSHLASGQHEHTTYSGSIFILHHNAAPPSPVWKGCKHGSNAN